MVITPAMPVGADFLKTAPVEPRRTEPTPPIDEAPVARRSDEVRKSDEDVPVENEKPEDDRDEDDFSDVLNQAMMASGQVQQPKSEVPKDSVRKDTKPIISTADKTAIAESAAQAQATMKPITEASNQKQISAAATATTSEMTKTAVAETADSTDASVEELLRPLLNSQQTQTSVSETDLSQQPQVTADLPETKVISERPTNTTSETLNELRLTAIRTSQTLDAKQTTESAGSATPILKVAKPSDALLTIQADPDDVTEGILSALQRTAESPSSSIVSASGVSPLKGASGVLAISREQIAGVTSEATPENSAAGLSVQQGNEIPTVTNLTSTMTQGGDLSGRRNPGSDSGNSALQAGPADSVTSSAPGVSATSASSSGVVSAGAAPDLSSTLSAEVRQPLSSQVSRAVLEHLERGSTSDNERLTVRLDPPELGEMTIELSKTKEGLAVRVSAREAVTMDMLLARGSEIEQQLKSQDLNLKALEFLSPGMMGQSDSSSSQRRESSDTRESSMGLRSTGSRRSVNGSAGSRGVSAANGPQESSKALSFRA